MNGNVIAYVETGVSELIQLLFISKDDEFSFGWVECKEIG
jgi:hypothetical protein